MGQYVKLSIAGGTVVAVLVIVFLVVNFTSPFETPTPPMVEDAMTEPQPLASLEQEPPAVVPEVVATAEPEVKPIPAEAVEALTRTLSTHPRFSMWLVHDDLLERFVAAVEAIAEGYSPRDELNFLRPAAPFVVQRLDDELVISDGCYRRFDLATDVFCSLDTQGAIEAYRRLKPQITVMHRKISWIHPDFDERLIAAIDHLLETPVPSGPVAVHRGSTRFLFADDSLEELSDAQRQLLRMGSRNAHRIQVKLDQFRGELVSPTGTTPDLSVAVDSAPISRDPSDLEPLGPGSPVRTDSSGTSLEPNHDPN